MAYKPNTECWYQLAFKVRFVFDWEQTGMQTVRETFADFTFCSLLYAQLCVARSPLSVGKAGAMEFLSVGLSNYVAPLSLSVFLSPRISQ